MIRHRRTHEAGRSLTANFAWLFSDRVGRVAINLVVGVAVARHLGPAEFGVLSFAAALTSVFAVAVGLGIDEVLVRDLVRDAQGRGAWRASCQLRLAAAAISYAAVIGIAYLWRGDSLRVVIVVAIVGGSLLFAPADLIDLWFQARGEMKKPAVARQIALWTAAGWRLVLVGLGGSLTAFAGAALLEAALVAGALAWIFRPEDTGQAVGEIVARERRRLLGEGWPLLVSGLLVIITMQADRLILSREAGDAVVGLYAVAARITEVCYAVPLAWGAAAMPRLAAMRWTDELEYWRLARRALAGLGFAGLFGSAAIAGLARFFVPLVFGDRYAAAANVLVIHVWCLAFVFVVSIRSRLLVIESGTGWVLIISLLTAVLNIGCNLILIPRFGAAGAAMAAVGAWAFSALVAPWCFRPTRKLMRNIFVQIPSEAGLKT